MPLSPLHAAIASMSRHQLVQERVLRRLPRLSFDGTNHRIDEFR